MRYLFIIVSVAMIFAACRAPEGQERWPGALDVYSEASDQLRRDEMRLVQNAGPATEEELQLVREITARKEQMFAADPPQRVLDEAEMIFLRAGELPTLLSFYLDAAEARGEPSSIDGRIAWLYQRLGLENLALQQARDAVATSPNDPFAHFALAYVLGQQAGRLDAPYAEMIGELEAVLQLSPDFHVVGVVERNQLQSEYRRLRAEHGMEVEDSDETSDFAP